MKSQAASSKPTKTLASPSTKVFDTLGASTAPGRVIYAEFPIASKAKPLAGAIDIDDLVTEFEQSPRGAEAIAKGRKWVARNFYSGGPSSVAQLRLRKGWSQAELAKRAETSQPYIARLELGKVDPQVSTVRKIARALGVPTTTVLLAISPEGAE